MHQTIDLNIAEIWLRLVDFPHTFQLEIVRRFPHFLGKPLTPLSYVRILHHYVKRKTLPSSADLLFDSTPICEMMGGGSMWKIYDCGDRLLATISYDADHMVCIITDKEWNRILLYGEVGSKGGSGSFINGAFELILRAKMPLTGGLIFHSAGISLEGRSFLLVGHSGEGKSTMASLWKDEPQAIVMNDDRVAVRVKMGEVRCYGTPWSGALGMVANYSAPLKAIFLSEKSDRNELDYIAPEIAAPLLAARAFLPFWDRKLMEHSLDVIDGIVRRVPVYLLRWRLGREVIEVIRSVL
jgi:hypothetical protein